MTPDWLDRLTVRTQNVLWAADLTTPEAIRAATDRELLTLRNMGRRCLDELRAHGLRPDSCQGVAIAGNCVLPDGHSGDHLPFASRYARPKWPNAQPYTPSRPVLPSGPDLGILLLHSLRYSVGRRSTAPDTTAGLIRRYWRHTDDAHRDLLRRDLREEIERAWRCWHPELLGDECDRQTWCALWFWMEGQGNG